MSQRSSLRGFGMFVVVALCAALPSRADAPPGQYDSTMGVGTVYDTKTGLTWQQTAPTTGGDDGTGRYTWSNAKMYCTNLGLNGSGWRLPTVKELLTLVDVTKENPSIDTSANGFPAAPSGFFWSATPYAGSPSYAWYVHFNYGYTGSGGVTNTNRVRCVR